MIASVVNIDEIQGSIVIIVIEEDNLERMKKSDPITIESRRAGGILPPIKYPDKFQVLIAYEENVERLHQIIQDGPGLSDLVGYLRRGFEFKKGLDGTELSVSLTNPPKES